MRMKISKHHRTSPVPCPVCFTRLDAAASIDSENPPESGDFTVCLFCSSILRYDGVLGVVASSLEECPIGLRAKLARTKMLTEEFRQWKKDGKPWCN